jgi:hypothetical protein
LTSKFEANRPKEYSLVGLYKLRHLNYCFEDARI